MLSNTDAILPQGRLNLAASVGLVRLTVQFENPLCQRFIGLGSDAWTALAPGVEARATYAQNPATDRDRMGLAMLRDPGVLHGSSLAKYAAAFFKMSRSALTASSSLRSRSTSLASAAGFGPGLREKASSPLLRISSRHLYGNRGHVR